MPPPPPPFEYDTIIRNIAQANGDEVIHNIDTFLTEQGISLGFTQGKVYRSPSFLPVSFFPLHFVEKNTQPVDDATLLDRLDDNDPQYTRQCVHSYFTNVERMQGLETDSAKALKDVEKSQVALEEIIQDLEQQKDSL
jgi:hypothetical protein